MDSNFPESTDSGSTVSNVILFISVTRLILTSAIMSVLIINYALSTLSLIRN